MYKADFAFDHIKELRNTGASKAEIIRELAWICSGWPYVFGAWGAECTPKNRRTYADRCRAAHADYSDKIVKACPVLSGKQPSCDGCKWIGCLCFDCRGYTHWLIEQIGLQLYGDTVTTQWETKSNWVIQGDISELPDNLISCLFRTGHTGIYLGDGITSDCSTNVRDGMMPGTPKWQKFGIPAGLYSNEELIKAGIDFDPDRNIPTIRRGATGQLVKILQDVLNSGLTVDGNFGVKTESALKLFQNAHGLKADGICGPKTWKALGVLFGDEQQPPIEAPKEPETSEDSIKTISVPIDELIDIKDQLEELSGKIRRWLNKEVT